jgi:hypothetical protein
LLEPRALLAVTAALTGGDLVIAYNAAGDVLADIVSDGTKYTVTGSGGFSQQFNVADVTGIISVSDNAAEANQTFEVLSGTALSNPLQVNANVETTSLLGGITATKAGAVSIGSGTISLASDISTAATNGNVTLSGATTLTKAVSITTGSGAGNILFSSTLDGTTAGNQNLTLTAGTGDVAFTGAVGGATRLSAITIASAASVTVNAVTAASLTQTAGTVTTALNGAVNTNAAAGVSLTTAGTIAIAAAGDITTTNGPVSLTATGGITTAGDVTTSGNNVTFASATTLSDNVGISTGAGAGDITFASTLDGAKKLYLAAGTGAVAFKGAVGSVTPLAGLILISASSTTADFSIKLARAADSTADGGLLVAAGVNNVKMTAAGSSITGFAGNGVWFLGGSTNSQLSGFTVSENLGNGMVFGPGSYAGTTISGNAIAQNGDFVNHIGNGIYVFGSDLMIGGDANPASNTDRNVIYGNAVNGIEISSAAAVRNTILSNSIFLNGQDVTEVVAGDTRLIGQGIALWSGGNGSQVAPQILGVVRNTATGNVHVQVMVPTSGSFLVQLFANTAADEQGIFPVDAGGFQGRTFVGGSPSNTPAPVGTGKPIIGGTPVVGNTMTEIVIDASFVAAGDWLTATATLLDDTTPTNTSGFSSGIQVLAAPTLAVGGDAPATWSPEYSYQRINANQVRVNVPNGRASRILRGLRNADLVFTPAGGDPNSTVVRTATGGRVRTCNSLVLYLRPGTALPAGSGTLVAGPVGLPAARLYDVANPAGGPIITVGPATSPASSSHYDMVAALTDPSVVGIGGKGPVTNAQALAFVSRFQGGMRVATADVNGDGFIDLVTAPGAIPTSPSAVAKNLAPLVQQLGATPRVITIYNGNPDGTWRTSSINLSGESGLAAYTGGFQVSLANLRPENTGSGNAVTELVVASSNKVFVYEIGAASRGAKPVINPVTALPPITTTGTVTGLAAGSFTDASLADIVVATTTTVTNVMPSRNDVTKTTAFVQTFAAGGASFVPRNAFAISSLVQSGPAPGDYPFNVFFNGAGLAVGDIDGAEDGKPDLVLAASTNGLANFRVLSNAVVASGSQATINTALTSGIGRFTQASRAASTIVNGKTVWQPTGGPDYFTGMSSVPNAKALGANAPLSVAVVNSQGTSLRADIFAALGATNATNNAIRRISWDGSAWLGAATLDGPGTITVQPAAGSPKTRFPLGLGLRLG